MIAVRWKRRPTVDLESEAKVPPTVDLESEPQTEVPTLDLEFEPQTPRPLSLSPNPEVSTVDLESGIVSYKYIRDTFKISP